MSNTTSRIDFLLAARDNASATMRNVKGEMMGLDRAAGAAAGGVGGIASAAGIAGLVALGAAVAGVATEMTELARRGAVFQQLGSVLDDFAGSVGSSADAMISAAKKAAQGTISEYELILNANRALQFEVAKTPEQFAKLVELSTALGRAQGISDTDALDYIVRGIARQSSLILDNLGLFIDLDKVQGAYAKSLGKTTKELTAAERNQALLNEAFRQGATAIKANRDASDSAATNFERMDASIQNSKDALGALFAPAVAVVAQNIATAAQAAADAITEVGKASSEAQALDLKSLVPQMQEGRDRIKDRQEQARANGDLELAIQLAGELARQDAMLATASEQYFNVLRANYPVVADTTQAMEKLRNQTAATSYAAGLARAALGPLNYETSAFAAAARFSVVETEALNSVLANTPQWMRDTANAALAAGASFASVASDVALLKGQLADLESAGAGARTAIIRGAAGVAGIVGDGRAVQLAKEQIGKLDFGVAALRQQLKDGSITSTEFDYQLARMNDTATETFTSIKDADAAAKRFASQGLSAATAAANDAQQAFDELRGKVSGVLSGALNTGTGVDPDEILANLGFRSDAINENARRLADVAVKGFDSPWYEYFRTEFPALFQQFFAGATSPDGVKAQAANLLKNFQDGLNPELLDKETAKERVRRMLIGEAKMEELATEIANELAAEMGNVSVGQAGAAARIALGISAEDMAAAQQGGAGAMLPSPGIGQVTEQYGGLARTALDAFSEAARTYTEEANLGLEITGVLAGQLGAAASLEMIRGAARSQGAVWGSTFKESIGDIPEFIIDLIALRVVPRVQAAQQQQATTTGAR